MDYIEWEELLFVSYEEFCGFLKFKVNELRNKISLLEKENDRLRRSETNSQLNCVSK